VPPNIELATARLNLVPGILAEAYLTKCQIGLPFLDEALIGILPTDLMLIGAASGKGKTALCVEIAKYNASIGRRVLLFALEAEENEVEMRLLFQIESGLYFKNKLHQTGSRMDYRSWRLGMLDIVLAPIKQEAREIFEKRYRTLTTVYRHERFSLGDLEQTLDFAKGTQDLVIIDHFSYISGNNLFSKASQNQVESDMIVKIRDLNLYHKIPFVMAVHIRKERKSVIPEQEDIMGSSDIYKNATIIAMVTPKPNGYRSKEQIQETLITLPKTRTGGLGNLCGILYYSLPHQGYSTKFEVGRVNFKGDDCEQLNEEEWPEWLKRRS